MFGVCLEEFPPSPMCDRNEQDQPHVCYRGFSVNEGLQRKSENYCCPPSDFLIPQLLSPRQQNNGNQRRGDCGRETRGKIIFAKNTITHDLKPVGQWRFIESKLIVEIGND